MGIEASDSVERKDATQRTSIRALSRHEVELFRSLRLRALADGPGSFVGDVAAAEKRTLSDWDLALGSLHRSAGQRMFVACDDHQRCHGFVIALRDKGRADTGRVGGLWVDPALRGRGIGRALLGTVSDWAAGHEIRFLLLWVDAENRSARRLYGKAGFRFTGNRDTTSRKMGAHLLEMICRVGESPRGRG